MSPWVTTAISRDRGYGWRAQFFFPIQSALDANKKLNALFRDSGDNLSVPLSPTGASPPTHLGASGQVRPYQVEGLERLVLEHPGALVFVADEGPGSIQAVLGDPTNALVGFSGDYWGLAAALGLKLIRQPIPIAAELSSQLLLQTIVTLGDGVPDGRLIEAVAPAWTAIASQIVLDARFLHHFSKHPRAFEEFLAGAYERAGYQVTLTPRSGDKGRDVIAVRNGFGSVRILEQAKAYGPNHLVTHDDVRAMLGVLNTDPNSSKGIITTTSDFQPEILRSDEFQRFLPYRLELKNGDQLREWLKQLQAAQQG